MSANPPAVVGIATSQVAAATTLMPPPRNGSRRRWGFSASVDVRTTGPDSFDACQRLISLRRRDEWQPPPERCHWRVPVVWVKIVDVLADSEVSRALVIVAHPDDAEFWAGGTIARWSDAGVATTYLVLTDGDAGGFDESVPRSEIPRIRRSEQRAAANVLGVIDVRFLGWEEGSIAQSVERRRDLVRVIRQVRPQRILTWSPEWNWARFRTSCHVDHRATGELALTATYPEAGNRFSHADLADEGLRPWTVPEIWLVNAVAPNRYVDVTEQFDRKIEALRAHASQTAHRDDLAGEIRGKRAPHASAAGLSPDRVVEPFLVVANA